MHSFFSAKLPLLPQETLTQFTERFINFQYSRMRFLKWEQVKFEKFPPWGEESKRPRLRTVAQSGSLMI